MHAAFKIADWRIEPETGQVVRDDAQHRLEPKAMAVLVYLAEHAGELVTRTELEQNIWQDSVVTYEALTVTINKIRAVLQDDSRNPVYIETLAKRGYRLIAAVSEQSDTQSAPAPERQAISRSRRPMVMGAVITLFVLAILTGWLAGRQEPAIGPAGTDSAGETGMAGGKPAIAVLPFSNLNNDPAQDYFAAGITEYLLTDLSRMPNLLVTSRNSVLGFSSDDYDPGELRQNLDVRYVLTGSVLRSKEQLRIAVQLTDLDKGIQLWADRLDGASDELFRMQDETSRRIAARLADLVGDTEQEIRSRHHTPDSLAYDFYMRGNALYTSITKEGNELAREMFQKAVDQDPGFAGAYSAIALTYVDDYRRRWGGLPTENVDRAFEYAEKAIAIDREAAVAHVVKAYVYLYGRKMPLDAIDSAREAIRLFPNYADAYAITGSAYSFIGRSADAIRVNKHAIRLNPNASFIYYANLGRDYYFLREPDKAIEALESAVYRNDNYLNAHLYLAAVYVSQGRMEDANWEREQVLVLDPEFSLQYWADSQPYTVETRKERMVSDLRKAGLPE